MARERSESDQAVLLGRDILEVVARGIERVEPQRATRIGLGLAVEIIDRAQHAVTGTRDIRMIAGRFSVGMLAVEVAIIIGDQRKLDVRYLECRYP